MKRMRITSMLLAGALAVLALALTGGAAGAKSSEGTRSFHGNVNSIAKNKKALTVNTTSGSRVRFVIRASTTYEHIAGISGLSKGTRVEVKALRSNDRWIATKIEANPGRSGGGGSDDPPGDDNGGERNGSDDPPGDDHGSGGHGSDD